MRHFCTIITSDYLPFALALHESLCEGGQRATLHVLMIGEGRDTLPLPAASPSLRFYPLADVCRQGGARNLHDKYIPADEDAFRWGMKPAFLAFLLERVGLSSVVYSDCDMSFYSDWSCLFEILDTCGLFITPHWKPYSRPGSSKTFVYDEHFQCGIFNAGLVGANHKGHRALDWWTRACLYECKKDIYRGAFVDQSHLTVMQAYFPEVAILRHPGCNVAHWSEDELPRSMSPAGLLQIDECWPLVCAHFAWPSPDRFRRGTDPFLRPYFDQYLARLQRHGFRSFHRLFSEPTHVAETVRSCLESDGRRTPLHLIERGKALPAAFCNPPPTRIEINRIPESPDDAWQLLRQYNRESIDSFILHVDISQARQFCVNGIEVAGKPVYLCTTYAPSAPSSEPRLLLEECFAQLAQKGATKVLLYGAGQHTIKMLCGRIRSHGIRIVGIVDDDPAKTDCLVAGIPVITSDAASSQTWDAVVVSSDTIEDRLLATAQAAFPNVPVLRLYGPSNSKRRIDSSGS